MPFVHVKIAGTGPDPEGVSALQRGITALMADVLGKVGPLVGVLVEPTPPAAWSIGGEPAARAAHVEVVISAGSNGPEAKARFIADTHRLLEAVLGPGLSEVSYVVLREVPKDSWGYGGLTQARRAERGRGAYRPLATLRWVMVLIFVSFGIQKFTPQSAEGIRVYIDDSPFVFWLSTFGVRGEADLLGCVELAVAALLAAGARIPLLSALGALMGVASFSVIWSFFTTPGVVRWSVSTDPIAWNLTGEFLYEDVVLLCVCVVLLLASLPRRAPARIRACGGRGSAP